MTIARFPQPSIIVDINYYDKEQEDALLREGSYPAHARAVLTQMAGRPLTIPISEFLAYFLYHRRGIYQGYGSYDEIRRRMSAAESYIDSCLRFDGESVGVPAMGLPPRDITERVGESIGLSVISRLYGLHEADWTPLPAFGGRGAPPSFDFEIASDGSTIVQVETKGSAVGNNDRKEGSVPGHKASIVEKKSTLAGSPALDRYPASVRYGTIVALDPRPESRAKCWVVDPDPQLDEKDPNVLKLLKRMSFLHSWIALVSPRSQLASALATRLSDLLALRDPYELDGLRLSRGSGEPIFFAFASPGSTHSSFLGSKPFVVDAPAGGMVVPVRRNLLVFLGFQEELVFMAAEQRFESIMSFKYEASTVASTVHCVLPKTRSRDIDEPPNMTTRGTHLHFDLQGDIHYSPSGLVFGFLPIYSAD